MQSPIPAIRPVYSKDEMSKFSPSQGLAALFGVPRHYLPLVDTPSIDGYKRYSFKNLFIPNENNVKLNFSPAEQLANVDYLLSGPLYKDPASLIVVNSYPYFFSPDYGEGFLFHLAGSIASQRIKTRNTNLDFSYLSTVEMESFRWVDPKPDHVFAWGPITDDFVNFMYVHAGRFLYSYTNHTRILLMCVKDVYPVLARLGVDLSYPNFIFNLGPQHGKDLPAEVPKWAKIRKARQQKVVSV